MKAIAITALASVAGLATSAAAQGSAQCETTYGTAQTTATVQTVSMPAAAGNIVEVASKAGNFKTLIAAAKAAGLVDALTGDGPLTVFAPTDEAFAKLPEGTVEELLKPANKEALANILKYHVVPGRIYSDQAIEAGRAETAMGQSVDIASANGNVMVETARVVKADVEAANGVIHIIDRVILPE